jgi:hypothetical protein
MLADPIGLYDMIDGKGLQAADPHGQAVLISTQPTCADYYARASRSDRTWGAIPFGLRTILEVVR